LGILNDQAERLKKEYGCLRGKRGGQRTSCSSGVGGRPPIEIDKRILAQIIQPRMEEILEIAALEIKRSGYAKHLAGGVVLTGGGALIKGTADLAREVLGMPVKIGIPAGFSGGLVREIENPAYATAVGLIYHGLKHQQTPSGGTGTSTTKERTFSGVARKVRAWFEAL
jgi:cell division protein FtsA